MIETYTTAKWPSLVELLDAYPYKPYSGYTRWPEAGLQNLYRSRVKSIVEDPSGFTWLAMDDCALNGLISLTPLKWDSERLGMSAIRLENFICLDEDKNVDGARKRLLAKAFHFCQKKGYQYVVVRQDAGDLGAVQALESAGFITLDGILTFSTQVGEAVGNESPNNVELRIAGTSECEAASKIARDAFVYDRFHADPAISRATADELHGDWLGNSCNGLAADAVLVAVDQGAVLGFITCKLQKDTHHHLGTLIGSIVLVATAPDARRRGIGRALTFAALDWFRDQTVNFVEVGTQIRNIPASRLYENCGFRLVGSSVSLRKII